MSDNESKKVITKADHTETVTMSKEIRKPFAEKNCLYINKTLEILSLKNIYEIGKNFLYWNKSIKQAIFPKNFFINDGFLGWDQIWEHQPIGIKNSLVKSIKGNSIYVGIFELVHIILKVIMKETIKMSNRLINKQQMDFEDDSIKIISIKRSNSISHLIDFILSSKSQEKEIQQKGIEK